MYESRKKKRIIDKCLFVLASHQCTKADALFQDHFNTFETFLLNIPQHGLYNFSATDNRESTLLSVIVENGIDVRLNRNFFFLLLIRISPSSPHSATSCQL